MKKLVLLISAILLTSAISLIPTMSKEPLPLLEESRLNHLQSDSEDCNTFTYQLYPEAVVLWNQTWSIFNEVAVGSGVRTILGSDLKRLHDQQSDVDRNTLGLRIYYGLTTDNGSIPDLFLVNTINCQDVMGEDELILMVTADTARSIPGNSTKLTDEWIPSKSAAKYTKRWQTKRNLTERTAVYAYNYRWDQIKKLVGNNFEKDLHILYGLRTLAPQENQTEFQPAVSVSEGNPQNTRYGSIVYVNVLYTGDGLSTFDAEGNRKLRNSDGGSAMDDFARPCPKYCDDDSELVVTGL